MIRLTALASLLVSSVALAAPNAEDYIKVNANKEKRLTDCALEGVAGATTLRFIISGKKISVSLPKSYDLGSKTYGPKNAKFVACGQSDVDSSKTALFIKQGVNSTPTEYIIDAADFPEAPDVEDQCSSIINVSGFLIKADSSPHIPSYDPRTNGFSIVGGSNCRPLTGNGPWYGFYANGNLAFKVGYYGPWSRAHGGNGCDRSYCGSGGAASCSSNSVINNASKNGGNFLYLRKTGGAGRGPCYRWTASSRRVGGV